jgi:hypothetical protein
MEVPMNGWMILSVVIVVPGYVGLAFFVENLASRLRRETKRSRDLAAWVERDRAAVFGRVGEVETRLRRHDTLLAALANRAGLPVAPETLNAATAPTSPRLTAVDDPRPAEPRAVERTMASIAPPRSPEGFGFRFADEETPPVAPPSRGYAIEDQRLDPAPDSIGDRKRGVYPSFRPEAPPPPSSPAASNALGRTLAAAEPVARTPDTSGALLPADDAANSRRYEAKARVLSARRDDPLPTATSAPSVRAAPAAPRPPRKILVTTHALPPPPPVPAPVRVRILEPPRPLLTPATPSEVATEQPPTRREKSPRPPPPPVEVPSEVVKDDEWELGDDEKTVVLGGADALRDAVERAVQAMEADKRDTIEMPARGGGE